MLLLGLGKSIAPTSTAPQETPKEALTVGTSTPSNWCLMCQLHRPLNFTANARGSPQQPAALLISSKMSTSNCSVVIWVFLFYSLTKEGECDRHGGQFKHCTVPVWHVTAENIFIILVSMSPIVSENIQVWFVCGASYSICLLIKDPTYTACHGSVTTTRQHV